MRDPIRDNAERSRYELEIDGQIVFANYRRDGGILSILHVEAPPALRGSGAAGRLMQGIVETARGTGAKIVPLCGYADAWLRRHREFAGLVARST
jgi:predicted GNAT family acetyltransferase